MFDGSKRGKLDQLLDWEKRAYEAPSPPFIKRLVLKRFSTPNSVWVETGTFEGDTTAFLSRFAQRVYSIEPEPSLFKRALERFQGTDNVSVINGLSENILPSLLPQLSGDVCFWLDGHFSGGITHQGPADTPLLGELAAISANIRRFSRLAILVDDMRCYSYKKEATYPSLSLIVDWATAQNLEWHIEHDILIISSTTE